MLKKLFLLPLVIVMSSVNIYGTEPFIENLTQRVQALEDKVNAHIPEKVVVPELSPENTALVMAIAQKLRISDYYLDFWASKQEWLNTFSKSERTYIIGSHLLMTQKLHNISTITGPAKFALHLSLAAAIIGGAVYLSPCVGKEGPLPAGATWFDIILSMGPYFSAPIAIIASYAMQELAINPLEEAYIQKIALRTDIEVVKQLECRKGAISALEKMQSQLLVENNDAQQKLYAFFTKGIEALKALKTALND